MLNVRKISDEDQEEVWGIIGQVISKGDTYVFDPATKKEQMLDYWYCSAHYTYVAESDGRIVGTFHIKNNQPDLGSHIANAAFMTRPGETGKGIGRFMGEYALAEARKLGYKGMQFNIVVKSNIVAVHLWEKLGFKIIGEIPEGYNHATRGLTDILIMYQKL